MLSTRTNNTAYYRQLLSKQLHPLQTLDACASIVCFHRGQEICSDDQSMEHWYFLISGAARRCAIRSDGHRQIVDLLLPGDFFGLAFGDKSEATIEAITSNTVVASYPRPRIEVLADSDPKIARELRDIAFKTLSRMQSQMLILGRITAKEKVGSFILEMAARLSNGESESVSLPVSRYDIADYLGVSVETVSRALAALKEHGAIKFLGTRTVSIVDRRFLQECERCAT
jgi:CRP/FNR family transcriptional regulator, nitrogen fixation regulation protein